MIHVGATLRRLRLESGLSLRDVARRLGVSSTYLSRVEHGLDPVPTPQRLEALAHALGVPEALLLEVGHRLSPFVERYAEQEPQASALFLSIARHGLDAEALEDVQRYVERRFGVAHTRPEPEAHALAPMLTESTIVVGLHCAAFEDAIEIASARLATLDTLPDATHLTAAFRAHGSATNDAVGGAAAVSTAIVPGCTPKAALVSLTPPLVAPTPDDIPLGVVIMLVLPSRGREALCHIAHATRLAARGLADVLADAEHPEEVLRRVAQLERVR